MIGLCKLAALKVYYDLRGKLPSDALDCGNAQWGFVGRGAAFDQWNGYVESPRYYRLLDSLFLEMRACY